MTALDSGLDTVIPATAFWITESFSMRSSR